MFVNFKSSRIFCQIFVSSVSTFSVVIFTEASRILQIFHLEFHGILVAKLDNLIKDNILGKKMASIEVNYEKATKLLENSAKSRFFFVSSILLASHCVLVFI